MLVSIPLGYMGLNEACRCSCNGRTDHTCFVVAGGVGSLRGYCPPCFDHNFIDPLRKHLDELHHAYHVEMTRINGWRIKNEGNFAKGTKRFDEGVI